MAKIRITDKHLRSMQPPSPGKNAMDYDTELRGFAVRITSSGARTFILSYAFKGIERRFPFGRYPAMSAEAARRRALELRRAVDLGEDPAGQKQQEAREMTMGRLAERYLAEHAVKKRSEAEDKRRVEKYVLKAWRHRRVKDIRRADVDELVSPIAARGAPYEANHLLALVRKMFSFAVDKGVIDFHPCLRMRSPGPPKARRRALTDARELRVFWRITSETRVWRHLMTETEADCLRFMILTGCRPSEAAALPWSEIDMAGRSWTLSAERSKNKRSNLIPLVDEAFEILERRKKNGVTHVFGGARSPHMSANRLSIVLRRACKRLQRLKIAYFTPHDIRRTVETGMAAARVPKEHRDRVLNHLDGSVGGVHYNLYDYELEKKSALEAWALRLRTFLSDDNNVLQFRKVG